ncbi:unnamed protein product [Closterium sp. NIES-64]|nr:unnamed protein product [Closterium sp. NIES-64]
MGEPTPPEHTLDIPPETPPHLHYNHIITNPLGSTDGDLNREKVQFAPSTFLAANELPASVTSPPLVPLSSTPSPVSASSGYALSPPLLSPSLRSSPPSASSLCFHNISYSVPIRRHPLAFLPAIPSLRSSTTRSSTAGNAPTDAPAYTPRRSHTAHNHNQQSGKQQQLPQHHHHQQRRSILQGISGRAKAGQVTAIMGASGSGKTTLLDILSHRISLPSTPHQTPSAPEPLPSPSASPPPDIPPSITALPTLTTALSSSITLNGAPVTPLSSSTPALSPSITLNGDPVTASTMRRVSAYVMQDDLLFPALTVRETLLFAAELRLGNGTVGRRDKEEKVEGLMRLLGLTRVADSRIGDENRRGVSGGERKRVAIGVEMVGDPSLLFLDEPTSGLDSTCAFHVVKAVRDVARLRQSIVLMVLHQPSFRVLNLLDNLLLLGSGHTVFSGCPSELPGYLTDFGCPAPPFSNPVEFTLDLIQSLQIVGQQEGQGGLGGENGQAGQGGLGGLGGQERDKVEKEEHEGQERLKGEQEQDVESQRGVKESSETQANGGAGTPGIQRLAEFHREWVRTKAIRAGAMGTESNPHEAVRVLGAEVGQTRSAIVIRRTPALYLLRLLLIMITGLLIASLFWQPEFNTRGVHERLAFIAFLTCTLFFSSGDATPLFIQERNIFVRETTHNAYRPSTYLLASTLVYLPLHLLMSLAITLEAWWCLSLTGGAAGLAFMVLVCFCCLFTGNAIATFVSATVNNATVNNVILAYAVVITVLANFALVCGFYIERASIPSYWLWLHYISPLKYAYEALALNEFDRVTSLCYLSARDIYSSTPLSVLLDEVDVQRSLVALRPALVGSPFAEVSTSTCLQTGPELAAFYLGLTQLDKWQCVAILFSIGLVEGKDEVVKEEEKVEKEKKAVKKPTKIVKLVKGKLTKPQAEAEAAATAGAGGESTLVPSAAAPIVSPALDTPSVTAAGDAAAAPVASPGVDASVQIASSVAVANQEVSSGAVDGAGVVAKVEEGEEGGAGWAIDEVLPGNQATVPASPRLGDKPDAESATSAPEPVAAATAEAVAESEVEEEPKPTPGSAEGEAVAGMGAFQAEEGEGWAAVIEEEDIVTNGGEAAFPGTDAGSRDGFKKSEDAAAGDDAAGAAGSAAGVSADSAAVDAGAGAGTGAGDDGASAAVAAANASSTPLPFSGFEAASEAVFSIDDGEGDGEDGEGAPAPSPVKPSLSPPVRSPVQSPVKSPVKPPVRWAASEVEAAAGDEAAAEREPAVDSGAAASEGGERGCEAAVQTSEEETSPFEKMGAAEKAGAAGTDGNGWAVGSGRAEEEAVPAGDAPGEEVAPGVVVNGEGVQGTAGAGAGEAAAGAVALVDAAAAEMVGSDTAASVEAGSAAAAAAAAAAAVSVAENISDAGATEARGANESEGSDGAAAAAEAAEAAEAVPAEKTPPEAAAAEKGSSVEQAATVAAVAAEGEALSAETATAAAAAVAAAEALSTEKASSAAAAAVAEALSSELQAELVRVKMELATMESALQNAGKQAQTKADELARAMTVNDELRAELEDWKVSDWASGLQNAGRQAQTQADELVRAMTVNDELRAELEDWKAKKNNDAELEALREEYQHRLGAAERKVYALTKERDMLRREQSRKADTSTLLKEKDEIIRQVMAEGEELSKKQAAQEGAMKKLRTQLREMEEERTRLQNRLQVEEARVESIKKDKAATEKALQDAVERGQADLAAQKDFYVSALSAAREAQAAAEARADSEAKAEAERKLKEAGERERALVMTVEELRQALTRSEQQAGFREQMLRRDLEDMEKRCQAAEARHEELVARIPESTRPLLRQIEAMQESANTRMEALSGVERALNARLQEAEAKAAVAEERERVTSERLNQTLSRLAVMEAQLSCLRAEHSQLSRSLDKERQRAAENRTEYLSAQEAKVAAEGRVKVVEEELREVKGRWRKEVQEERQRRELVEQELESERASMAEHERKIRAEGRAAAEKALVAAHAAAGSSYPELSVRQSLRRVPSSSSAGSSAIEEATASGILAASLLPGGSSSHSDLLSGAIIGGTSSSGGGGGGFGMLGASASMGALGGGMGGGMGGGVGMGYGGASGGGLLRPSAANAATVEHLESLLRQKDGEIATHTARLAALESTRDSLAEELVKTTTQCESLRSEVTQLPGLKAELEAIRRRHASALELMGERDEQLPGLKAELEAIRRRHASALELMGERDEQVEELRADLMDVKQMYREQIDMLVDQIQKLGKEMHGGS